jgi:hypothetical protein
MQPMAEWGARGGHIACVHAEAVVIGALGGGLCGTKSTQSKAYDPPGQ